jgi:hypothetical protein
LMGGYLAGCAAHPQTLITKTASKNCPAAKIHTYHHRCTWGWWTRWPRG